MASSSSAQVTAQQAEGQQERAAYELKGVAMSLRMATEDSNRESS